MPEPKTSTVEEPDVYVEAHGGNLFLFRPTSEEARDWLEENTEGMWFAGALVVEPRYAHALALGLIDDGFRVS